MPASVDDLNLVSAGGLVPAMALAATPGLGAFVNQWLKPDQNETKTTSPTGRWIEGEAWRFVFAPVAQF